MQREFGATTPEHVREISFRFQLLDYKMRQGLTLECHDDAPRNQVAEAQTPGRHIWFGPKFFDEYSDELHSRPRVFIHERAHKIGVAPDMPALEIRVDGMVVEGAEFAQHGCKRISVGRDVVSSPSSAVRPTVLALRAKRPLRIRHTDTLATRSFSFRFSAGVSAMPRNGRRCNHLEMTFL